MAEKYAGSAHTPEMHRGFALIKRDYPDIIKQEDDI